MNENKAKPTKTSTRLEKGQKPKPGKQNDQRKLIISLEVLSDSSKFHIWSLDKVERLANLAPALSGIYINGPWE